MAYGSELYLGLVGEQLTMDVLKSIGLQYIKEKGYEFGYLSEDKSLHNRLKQAHYDALTERGLTVIDPSGVLDRGNPMKPDDHYVYVQGTDGVVRKTCVWGLEVDYDPREMGHTKDDMLVGVSLISRYFPVFLDWDKEHGGSGDTISLTPDVLKNIEIARKHLAKVLPFIAQAPIVFRERHY